jgi:hypothetical protein
LLQPPYCLGYEPTIHIRSFGGVGSGNPDHQLGIDISRNQHGKLVPSRLFRVGVLAARWVCSPKPFEQIVGQARVAPAPPAAITLHGNMERVTE